MILGNELVSAAPFQCALDCVSRSRRHLHLKKYLEPTGTIRVAGVVKTFGGCHPSSRHIFEAPFNGLMV
ncbi:hypothetical protein CH063_09021 [Colletotrichum higginsianum]|uniref:Uncharacterized protein n=1 Tax=Colletotrichum higginsianum (strain IMI 349063) TaxID=759273 RepID=H1VC17_COLHI|nr:hypothetical protein CH063_09021 [Colletotrichum higginsianum]